MDAAEARDISHMRDRDERRQQIWRIEYHIVDAWDAIAFIRAEDQSEALKTLMETASLVVIDSAKVSATTHVTEADND